MTVHRNQRLPVRLGPPWGPSTHPSMSFFASLMHTMGKTKKHRLLRGPCSDSIWLTIRLVSKSCKGKRLPMSSPNVPHQWAELAGRAQVGVTYSNRAGINATWSRWNMNQLSQKLIQLPIILFHIYIFNLLQDNHRTNTHTHIYIYTQRKWHKHIYIYMNVEINRLPNVCPGPSEANGSTGRRSGAGQRK